MANSLLSNCIDKRIEKVRETMLKKGIDVLLLCSPEHIFYLSNFNPILFSHPIYYILPLSGEPTLFVHSLRARHAHLEAVTPNIVCHGKWGNEKPIDLDSIKGLAKIIGKASSKSIAVDLEYLDCIRYRKICEAIGAESLTDFSVEMLSLTMIKDAYEIEMIKGASRLADCGIEIMIECLRSNCTEAEAVTEAQYAMRKLWQKTYPDIEISGFGTHGTGIIDSLNCWVLTDYRISFGCDCSKNVVPKNGDLVLPMVWGKLGGYHAENERSLIVGETSELKLRAYKAMTVAHQKVLEMVSPGVAINELYNEANRIFTDYGFADITPGRIGHGVGLTPHEEPSIMGTSNLMLQAGMVFTVEPGLMSLEFGGVRHSDTVLVTENGCEILTHGDTGIITI